MSRKNWLLEKELLLIWLKILFQKIIGHPTEVIK